MNPTTKIIKFSGERSFMPYYDFYDAICKQTMLSTSFLAILPSRTISRIVQPVSNSLLIQERIWTGNG